jgi:hypothetical protein
MPYVELEKLADVCTFSQVRRLTTESVSHSMAPADPQTGEVRAVPGSISGVSSSDEATRVLRQFWRQSRHYSGRRERARAIGYGNGTNGSPTEISPACTQIRKSYLCRLGGHPASPLEICRAHRAAKLRNDIHGQRRRAASQRFESGSSKWIASMPSGNCHPSPTNRSNR